VSATWLGSRLGRNLVTVIDASWYLPTAGRDADTEYRAAHIPGAVRLDWDAVSDDGTDLPHMLPDPRRFAAAMEALGVAPDHDVVIYDGSGVNISAARAWWMFRTFGHQSVAILDGGFHAWARETRPIQTGMTRSQPSTYPVPALDHEQVRDRAAIERMVSGEEPGQLLDCRPAARFDGEEAEPRAGLRRGHIEGSANIPYSEFTDPVTGRFLKPEGLRALFASHGLDPARPIVASCGSGMSACNVALAAEVLRDAGDAVGGVAIYDGSWAEYGR